MNAQPFVRWEHGGCLPTPLASLWITGQCNLACRHCYEGTARRKRDHLPKETVKRIMDTLSPHVNSISFMGGEPTMHPDLPELCEYAKKLGKYTLLVSNGTSWTPELVTSLRDTVDCIKLGMDGADAIHHDAVRGKGTFAKVMRAWELLAPNISTMSKCTLNAENISQLEQIAPFFQSLGAKRLILNGWLRVGSGASVWNRRFALSDVQRDRINAYVMDVLKPNYHHFPMSRSCSLDHGCNDLPARTFYVNSDGALSPCIFSGHLAIGNVLNPKTDIAALIGRVNALRSKYGNMHDVEGCAAGDNSHGLFDPSDTPIPACAV